MSAERYTLGGHRNPVGDPEFTERFTLSDPETDALGPLDEGAHLPDVNRRADSYRRYKQWRASKSYNARNRAVRNEKTRERMTMLRGRQRLEPPTLQVARLAARQESARKYRENHRELLAAKAAASRAAARRSHQEAASNEITLRMQQRNRLDRALWDIEPTEFEQQ
ncbi:hypothetical protein B0H14DRAFT_2609489 [Mycena olivaceomarginata]|nr:hypothetical protein B0H14DRAFT_2609489 [Mycena olivaceomarginata]